MDVFDENILSPIEFDNMDEFFGVQQPLYSDHGTYPIDGLDPDTSFGSLTNTPIHAQFTPLDDASSSPNIAAETSTEFDSSSEGSTFPSLFPSHEDHHATLDNPSWNLDAPFSRNDDTVPVLDTMYEPMTPGVLELPASPVRKLRKTARLYALESLPGTQVSPIEVIASPSVVLALIVRLDAATLVAMSTTCRGWRAIYGPLLGTHNSHVRRRFARSVLETDSWSLAYTFPFLMARTLNPVLAFKAAKGHPRIEFLQWIASVPRDSGVDTLSLLRYYMCGAVRSGNARLVRAMVAELFSNTNTTIDAKRVIDWPLEARVNSEPLDVRTFVDFLVSQSPCDSMLVLMLVSQYNVRMTAFSVNRVIEKNTDAAQSPAPASETGALPSSLIGHYITTMMHAVQEACSVCDAKRVTFMWSTHEKEIVSFSANHYHVALMDVVQKADATRFRVADKIKTIEAVIGACTRINGPALAEIAVALKSLRLFEVAFDPAQSDPCASTIISEPTRIDYLMRIVSKESYILPAMTVPPLPPVNASAPPMQSSPPRQSKRQRTESSVLSRAGDFILPAIGSQPRPKKKQPVAKTTPAPFTAAMALVGTHRNWYNATISAAIFEKR